MGLFDALFKSIKPATNIQQGTSASPQAMAAYYYIATIVIPARLFRDENHALTGGRTFIKRFLESPWATISELTAIVALETNGRRRVPPAEMGQFAKSVCPLSGEIDNNLKYVIIEYPRPLPMQIVNNVPVAGPFYSAFVYSEAEPSVRYYLLRTNTSGRLDTGVARELFPDGTNFNLGSVSSHRDEFLTFIKGIETTVKPICAGLDKDGQVIPDGMSVVRRYFPQATQLGHVVLTTTGSPLVPASWRPVMD